MNMNAHLRMQSEGPTLTHAAPRPGGRRTRNFAHSAFSVLCSILPALGFAFCVLIFALPSPAQPTQEDVFRSIADNVSGGGGADADAGKFLAVIGAAIALVLLLALINNRRTRVLRPRSLQHPAKLVKEVLKATPLRQAELRQLKLLSEQSKTTGDHPVESPLTFLLCPSLLARTMKTPPQKVDRRVISQLARKLAPTDAAPTARGR